ncbi:DmsE family decaheme c-type cytochrome [Aquabacterium sp.]|uniref:DmsE family decaheme c-type cytochrome n=1 Tax=Aquabacterium sp. TaxID=1872578 RepID=UPI003783E96F
MMALLVGLLACCVTLPVRAATSAAVNDALQKDAVCTRCHDESEPRGLLSIYQTRHGVKADSRTPSCQSCHGDSKNHVAGGKGENGASRPSPDVIYKTKNGVFPPSPADVQAGACISCHQDGKRTHWAGSQHQSRDVPCAACHSVHVKSDPVLTKATQPDVCFACHKTERAQTHRFSTHPLAAGKMACTDCHNPHGSTGPKLLAKNSVNETCYTCHAEKRGPFLWEHAPVTDDCTNCHTPHGSTQAPLLKARAPWLCQECHSGDHGAQVNSAANLQNGNVTTVNGANPLANAAARAQMAGRACLNCHVLVHGSNHPAGSKFQR